MGFWGVGVGVLLCFVVRAEATPLERVIASRARGPVIAAWERELGRDPARRRELLAQRRAQRNATRALVDSRLVEVDAALYYERSALGAPPRQELSPMTRQTLREVVRRRRVVLLGEVHGGVTGSPVPLLEELRATGRPLALVSEFFHREDAALLGQFLSGAMTFDELARERDLLRRSLYNLEPYRELFEWARAHRIPVTGSDFIRSSRSAVGTAYRDYFRDRVMAEETLAALDKRGEGALVIHHGGAQHGIVIPHFLAPRVAFSEILFVQMGVTALDRIVRDDERLGFRWITVGDPPDGLRTLAREVTTSCAAHVAATAKAQRYQAQRYPLPFDTRIKR